MEEAIDKILPGKRWGKKSFKIDINKITKSLM